MRLCLIMIVTCWTGWFWAKRECHLSIVRNTHVRTVAAHTRFVQSMQQAAQAIWASVRNELLAVPASVYETWMSDHPYNGISAVVRRTEHDTLCDSERLAIERRLTRTAWQCKTLFPGQVGPDVRIPRVALCCSGGGFRAMLATGGFIAGLADSGLLDCVTYMAGVSGSTWLMAPWIASGYSIDQYMEQLFERIEQGIVYRFTADQAFTIVRAMLMRLLYGQTISAMDLYGPLLANTLLQDLVPNHLNTTLTQTHMLALQGAYPFPIYSAIATNQEPYEWFEVTPLEVGSSHLRSYVPVWAYGRRFAYGQSRQYAPEQTVGYYMAVCGSAFEADLEDLIRITARTLERVAQRLPARLAQQFQRAINRFAHEWIGPVRLFPSILPNFTCKMDAATPWRDEKQISLIDAGIDCNLPVAPLLRPDRKIDLIIIVDASHTIIGAPELRRASAYAARHNLPFPNISFETIDGSAESYLFRSSTRSCPAVLYVPLVRNRRYCMSFDPALCAQEQHCGTFNFTYTCAQAQELAGLMRFTAHEQVATIIRELKRILLNTQDS